MFLLEKGSFYEAIVNGYLIFGRKRVWDSLSYSAVRGFPCAPWPGGNQVSYVNHVAQFAKLAGGLCCS